MAKYICENRNIKIFRKILLILFLFNIKIIGLTIVPPSNWKIVRQNTENIIKKYVSPDSKKNFYPNVIISKVELEVSKVRKVTPEYLIKLIVDSQSRTFPAFKVIKKKKQEVDSVDGALVIASYAIGKLDIAVYQFVFAYEGEFYAVVFTCLLEDLKGMRPVFEESLSTMKL